MYGRYHEAFRVGACLPNWHLPDQEFILACSWVYISVCISVCACRKGMRKQTSVFRYSLGKRFDMTPFCFLIRSRAVGWNETKERTKGGCMLSIRFQFSIIVCMYMYVQVTCCMLQSAYVGILYLFYPQVQVRGKTKGFSFRLLGRSCRLFAASVPNPKKHGILNTKAVHSLASFLYRWILSYHIRQRSKKKGFQSHRIWCHFLPPFPPFVSCCYNIPSEPFHSGTKAIREIIHHIWSFNPRLE